MGLPQEVQTILIIAVGVVLVLAIWKGRGLIFTKKGDSYSFKLKEKQTPKSPDGGEGGGQHIEVGKGMTIEKSQTGDIGGIIKKNLETRQKKDASGDSD